MKAGHTQCAEALCEVLREKCEWNSSYNIITVVDSCGCVDANISQHRDVSASKTTPTSHTFSKSL